jgi:hypothetical protein
VQLLSFVLIGVWVYCLIDILTSRRADVRNIPKWAWFVIVVVLPPVGVVLWFLFGRPHHGRDTTWAADVARGPRTHMPRRARAPRESVDDEATIRARIAERDALLARWAEEDERRRRGEDPPRVP